MTDQISLDRTAQDIRFLLTMGPENSQFLMDTHEIFEREGAVRELLDQESKHRPVGGARRGEDQRAGQFPEDDPVRLTEGRVSSQGFHTT